MPRTSVVECPGCPPIRAITCDALGLVKVIEARGKHGMPKMVERWGDPESSRCVVAVSLDDQKFDPLLAIARKNGLIEILNPLNGNLRATISKVSDSDHSPEDDTIVGLHLFRKRGLELSSRSCTLLTCTMKGNVSLGSLENTDSPAESNYSGSQRTWNICASGNVSFSAVDGGERYALFGGKGVEANIWDLDKGSKIWTAKSPPKSSLGIFTPTWFNSATFLSRDDHRKFVTGTNNHQVRLYDISAQRRPVISFDFREAPIKAVTGDPDGYTIYLGTGSGDLASVDMRTGKLLGCFVGKCSGSIRSIARHPEFPVIASCGLDSYLRFWDTKSRQLLAAVFLKQHLTNVVIDSNFVDEGNALDEIDPANDAQNGKQLLDEDEMMPVKRKKSDDEKELRKRLKQKKKVKKRIREEDCNP